MPDPKTQSTQSWFKTAILSAVLYGIPMGLLFAIMSGQWAVGLLIGIIGGAVFGATFTLLIRAFANRQASKFRANPPDFGAECVLLEGPANHFKGIESVGGYLWLTDGRLHFASHSKNIQNHTWTTKLCDIRDVTSTKTLGLIDNGLQITTAEGTERFVVNKNNSWAEMIRKQTVGDTSQSRGTPLRI